MAATRSNPSWHSYDVWWWSDVTVDPDMVRWLRGLGVIAQLPSSTAERIGYRLTSRRNLREVTKVLGLRTSGGHPTRGGTARGSKERVQSLDVSVIERH